MSNYRTDLSEFNQALKESKNAQCVGCSYCCTKAPCAASVRLYGNGVKECPALLYDEYKGRYYCKLASLPGKIGEEYRNELAIGQGCCSPLFNQYRENIPKPNPIKKETIGKELRAFLHSMGRMGLFSCSGDLLYLLVHNTAKRLGKGNEWIQACFDAIKEERSKDADEFMGKIKENNTVDKH